MEFPYTGKSIEVLYETGYHFRIDYLENNQLRWTSLAERSDGGPMTGVETYYLYQIEDNIYAIDWIEASGLSVSQILNFKNNEVYAFMAWNDTSKPGGRDILAHKGKITLL